MLDAMLPLIKAFLRDLWEKKITGHCQNESAKKTIRNR